MVQFGQITTTKEYILCSDLKTARQYYFIDPYSVSKVVAMNCVLQSENSNQER
jgi:hypothetical protein